MLKTITRTCPFCKLPHSFEIEEELYEAGEKKLLNGSLIQNAFPTLTPSQRELLITGICDDCWDKMFKTEDDYFNE